MDDLPGRLAALDAAGDRWQLVARSWPDTVRVRAGRWQGLAWIRPAVFLASDNEPVTLLLHEDGTWFRKGTRQGDL